MLDLVITNGTIVDGTGRPRFTGDVGIRDGRIAAVGTVDEEATQRIDADGLIVAPGFIDIHTHYDAQITWDPYATPSSYQGVTTVVAGNCGFSMAPRNADDDYLVGMLSEVEGVPLEALQSMPELSWETFGDFLARCEGRVGVNVGFLVGHSAVRRAVMRDRSWEVADDDDLATMTAEVAKAIDEGALGFSSSWRHGNHLDHLGNIVPSQKAELRELLAFAEVVGTREGTLLEMVPNLGFHDEESIEALIAMSRTADRSINWNTFVPARPDVVEHNMRTSTRAAEEGACVIGLMPPIASEQRWNLITSAIAVFNGLPGWEAYSRASLHEKKALLADPATRLELGRRGEAAPAPFDRFARWAALRIMEAFTPETKPLEGRTIGEIAAERGAEPFDTLCDIALADGLRTVFRPQVNDDDEATWARRAELFANPWVLVGGSDAGAHLDLFCQSTYTTEMVGPTARDRGLLTLESAVRLITDAPARLYGLRDRGRITEGYAADVVIFDPETVGPKPLRTEFDLPGGAGRLVAGAEGIRHVLVNGVEIVRDGEVGDALPGTVLRSGRDTYTVTTADAIASQRDVAGSVRAGQVAS